MTQEIRRRIAARNLLEPRPRSEAELPAPLRITRFSQGIERAVLDRMRSPHVGRFSEGGERLPEDHPSKAHIGRFSDGLDPRPDDAPSSLHLGRFSQGADRGEA
jgi:hypothetical protein